MNMGIFLHRFLRNTAEPILIFDEKMAVQGAYEAVVDAPELAFSSLPNLVIAPCAEAS
jgi:hypothetical protein